MVRPQMGISVGEKIDDIRLEYEPRALYQYKPLISGKDAEKTRLRELRTEARLDNHPD